MKHLSCRAASEGLPRPALGFLPTAAPLPSSPSRPPSSFIFLRRLRRARVAPAAVDVPSRCAWRGSRGSLLPGGGAARLAAVRPGGSFAGLGFPRRGGVAVGCGAARWAAGRRRPLGPDLGPFGPHLGWGGLAVRGATVWLFGGETRGPWLRWRWLRRPACCSVATGTVRTHWGPAGPVVAWQVSVEVVPSCRLRCGCLRAWCLLVLPPGLVLVASVKR